jgi:hypothetical protein
MQIGVPELLLGTFSDGLACLLPFLRSLSSHAAPNLCDSFVSTRVSVLAEKSIFVAPSKPLFDIVV